MTICLYLSKLIYYFEFERFLLYHSVFLKSFCLFDISLVFTVFFFYVREPRFSIVFYFLCILFFICLLSFIKIRILVMNNIQITRMRTRRKGGEKVEYKKYNREQWKYVCNIFLFYYYNYK